MHLLDLILFFVLIPVIWKVIEVLSGGQYTEELGGLVGIAIMIVFIIAYIIIFGFLDYNWIDIFTKTKLPHITW